MKTRSSVVTGGANFTKHSSFERWMRKEMADLENNQPFWRTSRERNIKAIEIYEVLLKNFHIYHNGCWDCIDINCYWNKTIYTAFSRLIFLRREQFHEEFFEDVDRIIDAFVEKNNDLVYLYAKSTYTKEETIKLCEYYKKYYDTISPSAGKVIDTSILAKCSEDFSKCRLIHRQLGEYTPLCVIKIIDEWWAATKIQRWASNIIYQPAVYPAANRIVMRELIKDGLGDIFDE